MQMQWIFSSTFLPYTGEPIDFLLEDRSEPIHGTFAGGQFHSRWADYGADRVQSWRASVADPSVAPIQLRGTATTGGFIAGMKRLTNIFSRRRNAPPVVKSHSRVRAPTSAAVAEPPVAVAARHFNSNQISS